MIELAKGVTQIPVTPFQSINCYLLGDVLVDAGLRISARKLLRLLRDRPLAAHVLTHAHPDHQGASHRICAGGTIPMWCHADEERAAQTGQVTAAYPDPDAWMSRIQQRFMAGPGHPVARTLAEGDQVADFVVVHVPGHTSGQIALWREEDGTLIAGDAALNINFVTMQPRLGLPLKVATVDMDLARKSIQKLAALKPRLVAFGHGRAATGAAFAAFAATL